MTCNQQPFFPNQTYRPACFEGNGSTTQFSFSYPYINQDKFNGTKSPYLKVFIFDRTLGTLTQTSDWTQQTSSSVTLDIAPTASEEIWILRDSSVGGRLVDYASGSTVSEQTLDLDSLQAYYLWEEINANGELLREESSSRSFFGLEYSFVGDGTQTAYVLDDGTNAVEMELSNITIWAHINGSFLHSSDYSLDLDPNGIARVTFNAAPETGDNINIRVAQQNSLAVNIDNNSIGTDKLQDGSVTFPKLGLDGEGTDKQVAGWTGSPNSIFGANSLDHTWVSDFDAAVQTNALSSMAAPTTNINLNDTNIINAADPVNPQDLATKAYVDSSSGSGLVVQSSETISLGVNEERENNSGRLRFYSIFFRASSQTPNDTLKVEMKPISSGSWQTLRQTTTSINEREVSVSFFLPSGFKMRVGRDWAQNMLQILEQQF